MIFGNWESGDLKNVNIIFGCFLGKWMVSLYYWESLFVILGFKNCYFWIIYF